VSPGIDVEGHTGSSVVSFRVQSIQIRIGSPHVRRKEKDPGFSAQSCPFQTYAYKIDYVNYICPLNVEKLIAPTPPLSNTQPLGSLGP
jgi:hypothetical protein